MHKDQVNKELEKFEKDTKNEGKLKVPLIFPVDDPIPVYSGSDMDFGEPKFVEENKEKAIEISLKKKKKNKGLPDL